MIPGYAPSLDSRVGIGGESDAGICAELVFELLSFIDFFVISSLACIQKIMNMLESGNSFTRCSTPGVVVVIVIVAVVGVCLGISNDVIPTPVASTTAQQTCILQRIASKSGC